MKYGNFYDLESLTLLNRHEGCACSIKECDVEKVNRLISRMREDRERVGLPTAGDVVTYITRGGDYYPQAHIERGDDREVHICLLPQTPFCHENEKCTGYNTEGGPWVTTGPELLIPDGIRSKQFRMWGHTGRHRNGAVLFHTFVRAWKYTEPDPLYGKYTTKEWTRYLIECQPDFNEEDKKNLRETGNMGRVAELNLRGSEYTPCLISIDKSTNELVAVRQEHVYIPQEVSGVKLTAEEIRLLKEGQPVKVEGMTSKAGKEFDATLQYSAERRGLEFIFPKNQIFNERSIGGVPLSPTQIKMLSEGHTILVEDMKFRNRNDTFSSFVTIDKVTGRPNYTRHNPETGEIYIPKEICNVQLTAEDRETLRKGQPVYLENMIGRNGEEFSSFVKLDMNTGRTMYSRTPNGFNEQQAPRIPAEVYGHVFTAQEKANLQDGKTLLVEGLKNNGQTFSSYLKVNPYSGQLQYFQENPDIRRDTSRRAAQTETAQGQQQEQKKGASQAV